MVYNGMDYQTWIIGREARNYMHNSCACLFGKEASRQATTMFVMRGKAIYFWGTGAGLRSQ